MSDGGLQPYPTYTLFPYLLNLSSGRRSEKRSVFRHGVHV